MSRRLALLEDRPGWRRQLFDRANSALMLAAAAGVLLTVVLMLGFLVWSVLPLASPVQLSALGSLPVGSGRLEAWGEPAVQGVREAPADTVPDLRLADLHEQGQLQRQRVVAAAHLPGARALLVAEDNGSLRLFARSPADAGAVLLRRFETGSARATALLVDPRQRLILALQRDGRLQVFHGTRSELLLDAQLLPAGHWDEARWSTDAQELRLRQGQQWQRWQLRAPHAEVSWRTLWQPVHYEGYPEPAMIWQSTAAYEGGESKFSLTPLVFGTFKAALYCMLFAAPIGVAAAIYTAYFMGRPLRRAVKPGIELMEAFPTVVLGFIAGLWLAPQVERLLPAVLLLPLLLPPGVLLFALLARWLPARLRIPVGSHPLLLLPWLALLIYLCLSAAPLFEQLFFAGDVRAWLQREFGLGYAQRNTLVVGMAMGFAVIPTVFSIAEDAVFSVPRALSDGSLALGATAWQTLTGVVLPMASPGIFSALMIGLGRALGETMIVLMATGNTALMQTDPFSGLRSLAANIAMEAPEAIAGTTHFRVLFLSALVLFAFTFAVNTLAEWVRLRLRQRYASL